MRKVAIVTGCNRGIGFFIANGLAQKGYDIVMACRNQMASEKAKEKLKLENDSSNFYFYEVDLEKPETIDAASKRLLLQFPSGVDVLVNNAGFAYPWDSTVDFSIQAVETIKINYEGTKAVCTKFIPLIKKGGVIVTVASTSGSLEYIKNIELLKQWGNCAQIEDVDRLLSQFVSATKTKMHVQKGWPESAYGVSKLGLIVYTRILSQLNPSLHIFSCCPGYCRTDMSSYTGNKSAEEGSDTPVWLATSLDALKQIKPGAFVRDRQQVF